MGQYLEERVVIMDVYRGEMSDSFTSGNKELLDDVEVAVGLHNYRFHTYTLTFKLAKGMGKDEGEQSFRNAIISHFDTTDFDMLPN